MKVLFLISSFFICSIAHAYNYFNRTEKQFYSQFGEDGIIDTVFKIIGTTNKFYVDIGAGDGKTISNIYNLSLKGWTGIGFEGAGSVPIRHIYQHRISAENIVELFDRYQVPQNLDFLSLDIDSIDLYVLAQLMKHGLRPRLICAEYNASFGLNEDKCVIYDSNLTWNGSWYYGASYLAFKKILTIFDYVPIATTSQGVNVFFIQKSDLDKLKNVFIGNDQDIFNTAKYGAGPNGGHPIDPLNRVFGSSLDVIKYIGLENY